MKEFSIIIEHGTVKRVINGPFNLCMSRDVLEHLVLSLQNTLDKGHIYGWVEIVPPANTQSHISDTAPIPWEAEPARKLFCQKEKKT